jgi:hypothetical protein
MNVIVGEMGEETEPVANRGALSGGRRTPPAGPGHNGERVGLADERSSRMADQVRSGTVPSAMSESSGLEPQESALAPAEAAGTSGAHESYHGRPVSWVSVSIIIVGFIVGGIGLVVGPTWWLVWTGGAVAAVGGVLGLATGIFNDWY